MRLATDIFSNYGLNFLARWAHVLTGITWIGLLYYFNFVQVPAFADLDAGARNQAVDKLASRALWWFRWAAAATFLFGLMLGFIPEASGGKGIFTESQFFKGPGGVALATGILLGITMFLNVWGVIWRNQKVVIATTATTLGMKIEAYPVDSGSSICSGCRASDDPALFRGLSRLMMSQ